MAIDRSNRKICHQIYPTNASWQMIPTYGHVFGTPFCILQEKQRISCYFWITMVLNNQLAWYSHGRCNLLDTSQWTPPHDNYKFQLWRLIFARFHMSYCCESWSWQICWQIYPHPPNASWDVYYGMYLTATLDSSRKGRNFPLFLNNQSRWCLLWADGPPSTRAEMPWIPVHKTWQMNLLWSMDLPVPEQRWLACNYKELGRWTYFGWWTPQYQSRDALNTSIQNLADEPTLANGPPKYQSRDALNTSTQNLADEPTLANGPPQYQSRDALNTSTQNLADDPTLANGPPSTKA